MKQVYFEDKTFEKVNFKVNIFAKGEYEYCNFVNCDLSDCDLSDCKF